MKLPVALAALAASHPLASMAIAACACGVALYAFLLPDEDTPVSPSPSSPRNFRCDPHPTYGYNHLEIPSVEIPDVSSDRVSFTEKHTPDFKPPISESFSYGSETNISIRKRIRSFVRRNRNTIIVGGLAVAVITAGFLTAGLLISKETIPELKMNPSIEPSPPDPESMTPEAMQEPIQCTGPEIGNDITLLSPEDPETTKRLESVKQHLRRLHEGHHPSEEKKAEAIQLGIDLQEKFTIVDGYDRYRQTAVTA